MGVGATTAGPLRVSKSTTFADSFGAAAYGIKDSGLGTFLLLFYTQVVGVAPGTVGFIIMCALVFDAFIDPAVGALSDRTRSRWGRRHPWMYAAALPIAIGWLLLWNPPRSEEHTSELQSLMRISYAVFCLKKKQELQTENT